MRVLLTGAFGNIGRETLRELLRAGHEVRAFDLATPASRRLAAGFGGLVDLRWGDIGDSQGVARAVEGVDAVIHDAAIIPPTSERQPELTRRVNLEGTRHVVEACQAQPSQPRLVFASSISLFGFTQDRPPPRRADEPVVATDHYTRSKAAGEELVRGSGLDWVIVRFAAAPPDDPGPDTRLDLARFFRIDPRTRLEYLHPSDAGLAQTRALECNAALHRVLLIGGGEGSQIQMRDLNDAFLEAAGVGAFPDSKFGNETYYTDWLDTEESQRLLGYQRHDFSRFREALRRRLRLVRLFARPLRTPLRLWMLRHSPAREKLV